MASLTGSTSGALDRVSASRLWRTRLLTTAACAALAGGMGCADRTIRPSRGLLPDPPLSYSDGDWVQVLKTYVRDGLVNYDALEADPEVLRRYYALLSETGPSRAPEAFESRSDRVAYWINAYNALVLLAVLEHYPVSTMYDLSLPRLEYEYRYIVDGHECNLAWIEERMLADSGGDVRVLLATSRAAMGTPRLAEQPYRSETLDGQLTDAAARGLDNPNLCRVDHGSQSILVWQKILNEEEAFLSYWRSRHGTSTGLLFNVLLDLASPTRRRQLENVVGFQVGELPFDRRLNEYRPGSRRSAAP